MTIEEAIEVIKREARLACLNDSSLDFNAIVSDAVYRYWTVVDRIRPQSEGGSPVMFIKRIVQNVAKDLRATELHHHCQYTYRREDVRRILTSALGGGGHALPRDTDLTMADIPDVRADIRASVESLPEPDQRAIISYFYLGIRPENGSAARKRVDRAVERLVYAMNNSHGRGHVGSRQIRSNAACNAEINNLTE